MSAPILEAEDLHKSFRSPQLVEILKGVSFKLYPGSSAAITGRSGEGKTTLLHILGTLEPADSGRLLINGKVAAPANSAALRNTHIGFIFQSFNLLEDFTALDNVLMPAKIGRLPHSVEHGLSLLRKVGLESRAHFAAKLLSGGERQRVAIARALCNNPSILFADEPSGNLDKENGDAISNLLFSLVSSEQKALILVTHDELLASRCTHRYHLSRGHLNRSHR